MPGPSGRSPRSHGALCQKVRMVNDHPEDATAAEEPDGEGEAVPPGACGDGEPARAAGERAGDAGLRPSGEGGGVGDGEGAADRWFLPRKRSRPTAIRGVAGRAERAEHKRASQRCGWPDGEARGVRVEPAGEEAGGAGVWVAEDGGGTEEGEMAGLREGGMDGDAGGGGIQAGSDEEPDGGGCVRRGERRRKTAGTGFQGSKTASEKLKEKFKGQISAACSPRVPTISWTPSISATSAACPPVGSGSSSAFPSLCFPSPAM